MKIENDKYLKNKNKKNTHIVHASTFNSKPLSMLHLP